MVDARARSVAALPEVEIDTSTPAALTYRSEESVERMYTPGTLSAPRSPGAAV